MDRELSLIEWIFVCYIAFTAGLPIILCLMGAFAIAYISNIFSERGWNENRKVKTA